MFGLDFKTKLNVSNKLEGSIKLKASKGCPLVASLCLMLSSATPMVYAHTDAMLDVATLTDHSSVTMRPSAANMIGNEALSKATQRTLAQSQMIDLATKQVLTPEQFVAQLARQDYVILGEFHDSAAQHKLAYWLLDSLNKQRKQGSLLLEMMTVDQQPNIDKLAQSIELTELNPQVIDLNELKQALAWQSGWNWQFYGNIAAHPLKHHYPLIATNLTRSEISAMMKEVVPVQGHDSTNQTVKASIKDSILANHHLDNASDEDMQVVNKMVEIQQHRDRRMAEMILSSPAPSLLLTGNFHAQKAVGVPLHLADLQYDQRIKKQGLVVMMVDSLEDIDGDDAAKDADYAWVITGE